MMLAVQGGDAAAPATRNAGAARQPQGSGDTFAGMVGQLVEEAAPEAAPGNPVAQAQRPAPREAARAADPGGEPGGVPTSVVDLGSALALALALPVPERTAELPAGDDHPPAEHEEAPIAGPVPSADGAPAPQVAVPAPPAALALPEVAQPAAAADEGVPLADAGAREARGAAAGTIDPTGSAQGEVAPAPPGRDAGSWQEAPGAALDRPARQWRQPDGQERPLPSGGDGQPEGVRFLERLAGPDVGPQGVGVAPTDGSAPAVVADWHSGAGSPETVSRPDVPPLADGRREIPSRGPETIPVTGATTTPGALADAALQPDPVAGWVGDPPGQADEVHTPRPGLPEQASDRAEAVRPAEVPPVARGLEGAPASANRRAAPPIKGFYSLEPVPADETAGASSPPVTLTDGLTGVSEADRGQTPASRGGEVVLRAAAADQVLPTVSARTGRRPDLGPEVRRFADAASGWTAVTERTARGGLGLEVAGPARSPGVEADLPVIKGPAPQAGVSSSGLSFGLEWHAAVRGSDRPSPGASPAGVRTVEPGDVASQIVRAAHLQWRDGVGEARLRLNPEHLGEVTITLRVEQGAVFASIRAESQATLQAIQARQQELQAALEAQGLHLDHFVTSADADEQRRQQAQYRQARHRRLRTAVPDGLESPRFEVLV
jgi:hypothetical protein